jgi:hypothetical protein
LDPLDATVLQSLNANGGAVTGNTRNAATAALKVTRDQVDVSISNLANLDLIGLVHAPEGSLSPFGREFLRAIAG